MAIRHKAIVIKDHGAVRYYLDFVNKVETEEGKIIKCPRSIRGDSFGTRNRATIFQEDDKAATRFGMSTESLKFLGDFENYVYEGKIDGVNYVLRLTHSSHRSTNMVLGELEWINYLEKNGVSVAKALHSASGRLAEEVHVGADYFVASAFEKAKGRLLIARIP